MTEYDIFTKCFTELNLSERQFKELIDYDSCEAVSAEGGFALINGDKIVMLAVLPEYRRRGTGSKLLERCEQMILRRGFGKSHIGGSELLLGAAEDSIGFFARRGYSCGEKYAEMGMELSDFALTACEQTNNVSYGWFDGQIEELKAAVAEVDDDWVQYFTQDCEVFCGFIGGKPISFCIVGFDELCLLSDSSARVGSVGCVGTVPSARKRGIGLRMVALATEQLRLRGCGRSFIHYTALEDWYGKLGYKTVIRFAFCEKELR